jgi:sarcosine oxidase subunit gamma
MRNLTLQGEQRVESAPPETDLSIALLEPSTILRVHSWDIRKGSPHGAEQALNLTWPRLTGTCSRGLVEVLCVGPTDWLVLAAQGEAARLLELLSKLFHDSPYRASDISVGLSRVQIQGLRVRELLAKACSVDVHPEAFPPGRSTRMRFASVPVVVRCIAKLSFECLVARSYAEYLVDWLKDAGRELA